MIQFLCFAFFAARPTGGSSANIKVMTGIGWVSSDATHDDIYTYGMLRCEKEFPASDGWSGHGCSYAVLNEETIELICSNSNRPKRRGPFGLFGAKDIPR